MVVVVGQIVLCKKSNACTWMADKYWDDFTDLRQFYKLHFSDASYIPPEILLRSNKKLTNF